MSRRRLAGLLVVTALLVAGAAWGVARKMTSARNFEQGKVALKQKNYDLAIKKLTAVTETDPNNYDAQLWLSEAYLCKGEYRLALAVAEETVRIDPKDIRGLLARGDARSWLGDWDGAIADYDQMLRTNPERFYAYYANIGRGQAYADKKAYQLAIRDYNAAIRLYSDVADPYWRRGVARYNLRNYDRAVDDFRRALELDAKHLDTLNAYAWLLATCPDVRIRDGKRAVEFATRACELTEWKDGGILERLAAAYAEVGNFEEAVKWQRKSLENIEGMAEEELKEARERLKLYEKRKPFREN